MVEYSTTQFLAVFIVMAAVFALTPLALAALWSRFYGRRQPARIKDESYECGLPSSGPVPGQFNAQYYLYGLLFLVFDVEILFLMPFAVAFLDLPLMACGAMALFILLLVEGLLWAWWKGLLRWR